MKSIVYYLWMMILFILMHGPVAEAQTQLTTTPNASPQAWVGQTIGLTNVKVVYHRPSVKGRKVWGNLVQMDNVWRAGANDNTVIKFSTDVKIEGKALKAGVYGLHIIPSEETSTIIFSNNSTAWGSFSYTPEEDALRVEVKTQDAEHFYEVLTFEFDAHTSSSAVCALKWEKKKFAFNIETDVHNAVLANFRKELQNKAGWTWQGWNEAANYCLQNGVNLKEGLAWATRSVFMTPTPQNMLVKAKLTSKLKGENEEQAKSTILATLGKDLEASSVTWKEYNGAANYAYNQKAYNQALAWAEKATAMSPNMTAMMAKSNILAAQGDEKSAKKVKLAAIEKGTNAELNNYGYQLLFSGKKEAAVEIFEANTKKNPEDPNVWDSLGEGYLNIGQKDKAVEALKKSLSLNPPANVKANSIKLLKQMGIEYDKVKP
jgi:tetratricopeptide (TPR) repeat protein